MAAQRSAFLISSFGSLEVGFRLVSHPRAPLPETPRYGRRNFPPKLAIAARDPERSHPTGGFLEGHWVHSATFPTYRTKTFLADPRRPRSRPRRPSGAWRAKAPKRRQDRETKSHDSPRRMNQELCCVRYPGTQSVPLKGK